MRPAGAEGKVSLLYETLNGPTATFCYYYGVVNRTQAALSRGDRVTSTEATRRETHPEDTAEKLLARCPDPWGRRFDRAYC